MLRSCAQDLPKVSGVYDPDVDHLDITLRRLFPKNEPLVLLCTDVDMPTDPDLYDQASEVYYTLYDTLAKLPWRQYESHANLADQRLDEFKADSIGAHSELILVQYHGFPVALCKFGDCSMSAAPTFLVCRKQDLNTLLP